MSEKKIVTRSVRMPEPMDNALVALAKAEDRSTSSIMRHAFMRYLRYKQENQPFVDSILAEHDKSINANRGEQRITAYDDLEGLEAGRRG